MVTLKRILAGAVIVLCILGILVAALGVVAVWRVNTPITESLTGLLTSADAILYIVESGLISFNTGLTNIVDLVQSTKTTIAETGKTVKETNLSLALIDATIGDELFPLLEEVSTMLNSIVESVVAVNDALEAFNSVPFITVPTLTADLEAAERRLAEIQNDVEETQTEVQAAKDDAVDSIVSPVSARLEQVGSDLQFVNEKSTQFESQVTASREAIADVIQKLPGWIDLASVIMTLTFSWLIFAQGTVLVFSYAYIRTGDFKITLEEGKSDKDGDTDPQDETESSET